MWVCESGSGIGLSLGSGLGGPSARRVAELRRPLGDDLVHGVTQPVERLVDRDAW